MTSKKFQAAAILATLALATTSMADEFHYNNILIGDRASGMGGAYTAVSDDAGGMYYNPAGIAYSTGKSLSASVNAYNSSNRTYKGVIGGQDWTRSSSTLLPNFFGVMQPVGKIKLGFSYAVPDSNQEDQDQMYSFASAGVNHVINFNNKNDTNLFGPSIAAQLSDTFSIGTTLYVHKRNTEAILNNSALSTAGTTYQWVNQYTESDEWGIRPIIGVMWSPADKVSLGLTVMKTFILTSKQLVQQTSTIDSSPGPKRIYNESSDKREYPYQFAAGVAFFPNSSLLISGDLTYSTSYDYTFIGNDNKREAVLNAALGVEYYLDKKWVVRGGLFTDFANTPKIRNDTSNQFEHIDMYGGSLTVSHFTKNTSISVGGCYKYGDGKAKVAGGANGIQDVTADNWTLFISSSYSY